MRPSHRLFPSQRMTCASWPRLRVIKGLIVIQAAASRPVPTPTSAIPPHAANWSADLVARGGYRFHVRPAAPADEDALSVFFTHVDRDDLRFRFLSAIREVRHDQVKALVTVDHARTENFLAIEAGSGLIIATAMLAANAALTSAEVAIAIRSDFKHLGISWTLLEHVARFATAKGMETLESIESRGNLEAIKLEHEMGWVSSTCPGEPTLIVLRKSLRPPQV